MDSIISYKIRPAGRHILTIGRDLIQDSYAAVVELVKNAYDADSPDIHIEFRATPNLNTTTIVITDRGHGMSRDTVVNKWMVPSTKDKQERRKSPSGRIMQGRKGVGRYAASILGTDFLLETVDNHGDKTTAFIEWDAFENAEFLEDVEILIETIPTLEPSGTKLTMSGDINVLQEWDQTQFNKLRFELKKLIPPISSINNNDFSEDFRITLSIEGFPNVDDIIEKIVPYPIFDLFDYRITGFIGADGNGTLRYSQQNARNTFEDEIIFDSSTGSSCGDLFFDIRAYDRDKNAIESLIERGLRDERGNYVGKLQARQLLNEYNGIGVYRNGFRIRPLGDADFDWLKLNEQRIQNPSLRIGNNQVIGYVLIQSDESSGLVEKSARDGLKENKAFSRLKEITRMVISKLEERRFDYRRTAGISRPATKVERELEGLFSFDALKKDISFRLTKGGVDQQTVREVFEIIDRDAEEKNKVADDIRQTVAIYQGQATLGKIINVILHEGRRPLNYFNNQIPNMSFWANRFRQENDIESLEMVIPIAEGIAENADIFVKLFSRLDPLAAGKRVAKKLFDLKKIIQDSFSVFTEEMKTQNVQLRVIGEDGIKFLSWQQDIYAIFTNLADNSLYWMENKKITDRQIIVEIVTDNGVLLHIDYHDTGPGIEPKFISSEMIFEPEFSTKKSGTGLGLAIAGEAAMRNGLELKAFEAKPGAWFRLQPITEDNESNE
ncbi:MULTISPECIES: sensor histidine kinase [Serratia]|uniref:sensor histidine kinase n=1 Tax=Serratia TaxID=613 RepID=UPI0027469346|nr:sensor histidine kinase [Serratia marcescens]MDP8668343.1 sensor histidine kinase [Serratia marcescens]MDP8693004.1 sensor histidine kinase [Serratia marcescens]MDP8722667.1 sensor histidine kinase [Serratia marcescens]